MTPRSARLVLTGLIAGLVPIAAVTAASLQIVKSSTVVADQVNTLNPRALPGSDVDFTLVVTNPNANVAAAVRSVVIVDTIPDAARLRVSDYGATGSGPVGFTDGSLLGLGLAGSGLSYTFSSLGSTTDGLDFYDGTNWGYVPVPDANGFDSQVRAIRVTLSGTQVTGSSFQLQYRTRLR